MNPVTLRWLIDGVEQDDPIHVLWTTPVDGYHVSLLSHPELNYVIVRRDEPFTDGQGLDYDDLGDCYIELGRPDAGQLALALITALINNSDQIINSYIERMRTARTAERAIDAEVAAGRLVRSVDADGNTKIRVAEEAQS